MVGKRLDQRPVERLATDVIRSAIVARRRRNRSRPQPAGLLAAGLVVAACSGGGAARGVPATLAPGAAAGFNVLVLTLDTTRADHLGCYGKADAETPAIDGLAADGVRFADAVTVAPVTLPSHATIFTGLTPPSHGIRDNSEYKLAPRHVTLAETLGEAGYETAAFLSAFVLDARFGLDQGFDVYDDRLSTEAAYGDLAERDGTEVTNAAIRWLEKRSSDAPFFMWVHYFDPHHPYTPPPGQAQRFASAPYDGEIAAMDRQIGRLLATLDERELRDETLVVVVADHGESLGEHDEATHGMLIYESVMHVPLILSCPALVQGAHVVDDVVVSTTDVTPTVLDLLGIDDGAERDGLSLLEATQQPDRTVYMEALTPYLESGWSPLYGLRRHGDKYIEAPRREYYDLNADPTEWNNLYGSSNAKAGESLVDDLTRRLAEAPPVEGSAESRQELEPEALAMLESLGYAAGVDPDERTGLEDPKDMMVVMKNVGRAEALIEEGKLQEALLLTQRAAERSPRHRRVLIDKATIEAMLGRNDEALATLEVFNGIRPSADGYLLMAQIQIAQGKLDEARGNLAKAEALEPRHGGICIARGDMHAIGGDAAAARREYERAIEIDPNRITSAARARIANLRN